MKKLLALASVVALSATIFVVTAQEKPKVETAKEKSSCCATKASTTKASCDMDAKAMKASNMDQCTGHDAKMMKASNKEGKTDCCAAGAKAMKASNKAECDMSKEDCDMSKCSDDCKMAHNTKSGAKSTNKN